MSKTAVVIGGGIGGLATAIGLHRIGWNATVIERSPTLEDAGAGISLAANGLHALDELGIGHAVREASRNQYTGGTRTPNGTWLTHMNGAALEEAVGTPIVGIPRTTLHRLLREHLPTDTLLTGTEAGPIEQTSPTTARVTHGTTTLDADLVIAADGINSHTRHTLFPTHPHPTYTGSTVLRAITDHPVDLHTDFELTWGHGTEFGHIAFPDGRAEWHAVLDLPARTRFTDPLTELRRRFRTWHDPIPALLDATHPDAVLHHDINELPTPLPTYVIGPIALLGDAAHAMTPHLGQGACQALEDAVTLAAALATEPTVPAALARYDAERRPRTQAVARAARQAGRMGQQLTHPMAVALRNTAMRLTPSRAATRMILRHHTWVPPRLA